MKYTHKINIWNVSNIRKFTITKTRWDKLLLKFSLYKKLREIEIIPGNNGKVNRYLLHCQLRLLKQITKGRITIINNRIQCNIIDTYQSKINNKYWKICKEILNNSLSYKLMHLSKIELNYGRKFSLFKILNILKVLERYSRYMLVDYKMKRKWLQAPAGKARALTIPNFIERIYASMWTGMLELYLLGSLGKNQHAYQSNKGCISAWKELLGKLNNSYIYEFDLANFFPSVNQKIIKEELKLSGIPDWVNQLLIFYLHGKPVLSTDLTIKDYVTKDKDMKHENLYTLVNHKNEANFQNNKDCWLGVPMGLGYSPLLAILVLERSLKNYECDKILYADDGLLFSNNKINVSKFAESLRNKEINQNESKSGYIKENGKWLKDLKFLGIKYVWKTDMLESSTRGNKSKIQFWGTLAMISLKSGFTFYLRNFLQNSNYIPLKQKIPITIKEDQLILNQSPYKNQPINNIIFKSTHSRIIIKSRIDKWCESISRFLTQIIKPTEWINMKTLQTFLNDESKITLMVLNWRNIYKTSYLGTIMSRLYNGNWSNSTPIEQNFNLTYSKGSLVESIILDRIESRKLYRFSEWEELSIPYLKTELTVHTITSLCLEILLRNYGNLFSNARYKVRIKNISQLMEGLSRKESTKVVFHNKTQILNRIYETEHGPIYEKQIGKVNFEILQNVIYMKERRRSKLQSLKAKNQPFLNYIMEESLKTKFLNEVLNYDKKKAIIVGNYSNKPLNSLAWHVKNIREESKEKAK